MRLCECILNLVGKIARQLGVKGRVERPYTLPRRTEMGNQRGAKEIVLLTRSLECRIVPSTALRGGYTLPRRKPSLLKAEMLNTDTNRNTELRKVAVNSKKIGFFENNVLRRATSPT